MRTHRENPDSEEMQKLHKENEREIFELNASAQARRMTEQELKEFDIASEHPYECNCDLCKKWWSNVPKEEEE